MKQKFEKLDKTRRKERGETRSGSPDGVSRLHGCPVPEPIVCCGEKLSKDCMDEGIYMECTNVACPFNEVSVHEVCFKAYEEFLIRTLKTMGSARGWCETKLRTNLWEKKGQGLLAKVGRCRCGHGFTRRNEDAFFARQKRIQDAEMLVHGTLARKKKHRKELPTLNFPKPILSAHSEPRTSRPGGYLSSLIRRRRNISSATTPTEEWEDDAVSCYSLNDRVFDEGSSVFLSPGSTNLYTTVCKDPSAASLSCSKEDQSSQHSLYSEVIKSSLRTQHSQQEDQQTRTMSGSTSQTEWDGLVSPALPTPPYDTCHTGKEERFVLWSPFKSDFNLGETILATRYLPTHW